MSLKLKDKIAKQDASGTHSAVRVLHPSSRPAPRAQSGTVAKARVGKKATVGHFSEELSRKLNTLAAMEGRTLQSCMGEAWDLWLEFKGEKPFGER